MALAMAQEDRADATQLPDFQLDILPKIHHTNDVGNIKYACMIIRRKSMRRSAQMRSLLIVSEGDCPDAIVIVKFL
jgi:hypothetical protein